MAGHPWASGGGVGGANGLRGPAAGDRFVGSNGLHVGARGDIPEGLAGQGYFGNQLP